MSKLASIYVPKQYNDGFPVSAETFARIEGHILEVWGGFSSCEVSGAWRDGSGKIYRDKSIRYDIICQGHSIDKIKLQSIAMMIARVLDQECVLFTIQDVSAEFVKADVDETLST